MIFKQYCAVFFTPMERLDIEINKICEGDYNKIGGSGITIYTFSSALDVEILTDFFKSNERNFLIFDLSKENSGYNILDKDKENKLFGFLTNNDLNEYENLSNMLMDDILNEPTYRIPSGWTYSNSTSNSSDNKETTNEIENSDNFLEVYDTFTKKEINDELNKIIDKGILNLTDKDKKILQKLSNLSK